MAKKTIKEMTELEFARFFARVRARIEEDPIQHFVKATGLINFTPSPAQTVALKCVFCQQLDGEIKHRIYLEDTTAEEFELYEGYYTEIELYEYMTGFEYDPADMEGARTRINFIVGRRGGKSTLSSIIALYYSIAVNWKPMLHKTPAATVAVLSHSVDFSQEVLDIIKSMAEESEILYRLRDFKRTNTKSTFHLKVPFLKIDEETGEEIIEYSKVAVKVGAASKKTTRGRAVCVLLCDEIAWWNIDENSAESDRDVIRAVTPALKQFGKFGRIIKLSSPGLKQGVLYEEYEKRQTLRRSHIQLKAPSWVWNTILPADDWKTDWLEDPDGFDTEFRANFVDSISNFISSEFVDLCIQKGVSFLPPSENKDTVYTAAIDAAFKADQFAFSIVGHNGHRLTQYHLQAWQGSKQQPVQSKEVAKEIKKACVAFGITDISADQYAFQPLREIFQEYGLNLIEETFTIQYKRKIYYALKRAVHSQNIDLLDSKVLAKEIKELVVKITPTGQISIGHPTSGSDDLADATAAAAYHAVEKAGTMGLANGGEIATGNLHGIPTDLEGRAFVAPNPEMLGGYAGFEEAVDNSNEWVKDPDTGRWVKKSALEETHSLGGNGADFVF